MARRGVDSRRVSFAEEQAGGGKRNVAGAGCLAMSLRRPVRRVLVMAHRRLALQTSGCSERVSACHTQEVQGRHFLVTVAGVVQSRQQLLKLQSFCAWSGQRCGVVSPAAALARELHAVPEDDSVAERLRLALDERARLQRRLRCSRGVHRVVLVLAAATAREFAYGLDALWLHTARLREADLSRSAAEQAVARLSLALTGARIAAGARTLQALLVDRFAFAARRWASWTHGQAVQCLAQEALRRAALPSAALFALRSVSGPVGRPWGASSVDSETPGPLEMAAAAAAAATALHFAHSPQRPAVGGAPAASAAGLALAAGVGGGGQQRAGVDLAAKVRQGCGYIPINL